jgi:PAS domain S-box-containing protein
MMTILACENRQHATTALLLVFASLGATANLRATDVPVVRPQIVTVKAQVSEGRDISFRRFPATAGLSQTRVSQITQDDDGFLWFGTQSGLNRFDGYKSKVYKHDPKRPGSLSGVFLYSLFKDSSGSLWAGSDQYLDRFDPVTETFRRIPLSAPNSKTSVNFGSINQDRRGTLWLPTSDGLYGLNPSTGQSVHYRRNPSDPASLNQGELQTVKQDRAGALWVGMRGGLDLFDSQSGKVTKRIQFDDTGLAVWLHEDRYRVFWLMDGNGELGMLDHRNNRVTRFSFDAISGTATQPGNEVLTMMEDRDGTMWFGTANRGLLKYDRGRGRFISYTTHPGDDESLPDSRVIVLFQDREGNIWAGLHQTAPVHFSPTPRTFEKFTYQPGNPNSLGSALVSVIHEDRDGTLWMGADRSIKRVDRKTGEYSTFKGVSGHEVLSIVEQGPNVMWMGTGGLGLKRYNRKTGEIRTYLNSNDPSSLCSDFVEKLLMDRKGRLWEAAWGGLCYFDPATERFKRFNAVSANRTYHAIAEDKDGMIWLGSNLGLQRLDPDSGSVAAFMHSDAPESVSDNRINSIYQAQDGKLWIGTQNGLDLFDARANQFVHFNENHGLAGSVVACVLEDAAHRLWMSTNAGISSFDPKQQRFNNYTVTDGLPGPDLTGWAACAKSTSGEMFFGGFSGAAAFHPDRIPNVAYVPPVVLTGFRLFGLPVEIGKESPLKQSITRTHGITLTHSQDIFSIDFSALSYVNPGANRYRYRLEGLQQEWVQVSSEERQASYTTLPTGDYTFRVQGATGRGPWSDPGAALLIHVLPPWWGTWWFRTMAGLLVVGALCVVYLLRMRQLSARMQAQIREQQRAEESLRASQRHLTLIINTIPAMAWSAGRDGAAEFFNNHYLEYAGLTSEQATAWGWITTIHPDDRPRMTEYWRLVVSSGNSGETEARMLRYDGMYRWFLFRVSPLRDHSGDVAGWYGTNIDIHARKEAEEALRSSERDLRLTIETIPGLVWCATPDGELNYVNRRLLAYSETTLDDWAKGSWARFVHPDDKDRIQDAWSSALATDRLSEVQCRLRRSDGAYRWFQMYAQTALDAQGKVIRWYGLLLDIDERKRIEENLRSMETQLTRATRIATVGEFAAAIAHEINQPLAAIVANGHACLRWLSAEPPALPRANEAAERIVRDGKEAGEVVRRIRALFRGSDVEQVQLDLNEVIREVVRLLEHEAARKQVVMETAMAQGLPKVDGDRVQVQQLVFNLMTNAIEAMESEAGGARRLFIRSRQLSRESVLIEVQDSGPGLSDADKAFDAFYTTKANGMGMGLAICRSIVDAHRGRLWAESADGEGTTFSFTLPVERRAVS